MNRQSSCDSESILSMDFSHRAAYLLGPVGRSRRTRPRCLRVAAAFLPAARRLRVKSGFLGGRPRALRHRVSALRLPSVLQLCARDS